MLMEPDFLQSLRSFDKDHIPIAVVQKIKPYIANPEFEPNKILTVSELSCLMQAKLGCDCCCCKHASQQHTLHVSAAVCIYGSVML